MICSSLPCGAALRNVVTLRGVMCCDALLQNGAPVEGDEINVVWVVDSEQLPFYRAEVYHQFHNGLGKAFPAAYTRDLKAAVTATGKIGPTGCLELPF